MDIPIIQHSTTIAIRSFNVICIFTLLILLRRQETEQQQEQSEQNQAAVEDVNNFFEFEERDLMDQHEVQLASLAQPAKSFLPGASSLPPLKDPSVLFLSHISFELKSIKRVYLNTLHNVIWEQQWPHWLFATTSSNRANYWSE